MDSVTCHAGATAVAFPAWPRHRWPKKGNRRGRKRKLGEEERKEEKGADRWGRSAAREKGRGRASRVASWAACAAGRRGKEAAAQASRPRGAVAGRPPGQAAKVGQRGKKKRKRGWAGSVGPKWKKMNFSKSNHFPNLFPLFPRFKSNSNVI